MATDFRISIASCAANGFSSFLRRWNPLIEDYNLVLSSFYHIALMVCVLEDFNCMLLGGWTLMLGIGPWVLCT